MTVTSADFQLLITGITERGVQVATPAAPEWPFWLPRTGHVTWDPAPQVGEISAVAMPAWLAAKHKLLVQLREVASECVRHETRKETDMTMTSKPADAGTGMLFRNDKRETDRQPEYKGEITVHGKRFWLAAWIKTSERNGQKFFSLALREADEPAKPKPAKPVATEVDEVPF
jgi:hypothetical protein